jgi:hypothetical protein
MDLYLIGFSIAAVFLIPWYFARRTSKFKNYLQRERGISKELIEDLSDNHEYAKIDIEYVSIDNNIYNLF